MKNLKVKTCQISSFNNNSPFSANISEYCSCYDSTNNLYYVINKVSKNLYIFNGAKSCKENPLVSCPLKLFDKDSAEIVGIEYCSSTEKAYFALDNGLLIQISFNESSSSKVSFEDVAFINDHILEIFSISPDQDVLIFLTKSKHIFAMSSDLFLLYESNYGSSEFGQKQFINVGWGKKETQFHGSEGKSAAKAQINETKKFEYDDGMPKITWRGDGSLFAISYIDELCDSRRFKVFTREGVLQYTSEIISGLENTFSWRPSGNLIAVSRKMPNKHTVSFFEKNGLFHRDFTLEIPLKDSIKVHKLIWSRDSEILAVWIKDAESNIDIVQLWSEKNYHWYLRRLLKFCVQNPLINLSWSGDIDKDLAIITSQCIAIYSFKWEVTHSRGKKENDLSVVGVIDGNKLLLTSFRQMVIPPPMSQNTLEFEESINSISFLANDEGCNDILVILQSNKFFLCKMENENNELIYSNKKQYDLDWPKDFESTQKYLFVNHILWLRGDTAVCSVATMDSVNLCVLYFPENGSHISLKILQTFSEPIEDIVSFEESKSCCVISRTNVYLCSSESTSCKNFNFSVLHHQNENNKDFTKFEIVKVDDRYRIIALSKNNVLYVDWLQVANNVTSFFVHSEFLLLTTSHHSLISFKLDEKEFEKIFIKDLTAQPWEKQVKKADQEDHNIRRVERGSSLVVAVAKDSRVILQMPRGNLECINPRSLSISIIGSYIDELNYYKAFELIRKQRVDLNILYDHDPQSFITNVEAFVNSVNDASWLSLFISELKNEDVTKTLYSSSYCDRPKDSVIKIGKVKEICDLIRPVMEKNSTTYIQPILMSMVKDQKRAGLEHALTKVKELIGNNHENKISAEEALSYLLYVVDVKVLYDIALGMYDFDLVMFVAEKSQWDPKEYVPFLNNLKTYEECYMKYLIDNYLNRYDSALEHLSKINDKFEECLEFIETHEFYAKALKIFNDESNEYKRVANAYGQYLIRKTKYKEAGIMYTRSKNYEEAMFAFRTGNFWKDVITTSIKLDLTTEKKYEIYEDLVRRLKKDNKFEEAAVILLNYLNKPEESVTTLCEGKKWHQAWFQALNIKRDDMLDKHLKPRILEHAKNIIAEIEESKTNFIKFKNRLNIVRVELAEKALKIKANVNIEINDVDDFLSDTSSTLGSVSSKGSQSSRSSGRSYKSSKNRRKQERKLETLKEGSSYEDFALLKALHNIVSKTYQERVEIKNLATMLLVINQDELAENLYHGMHGLLTEIRNNKFEIWDKKCQLEVLEFSRSKIDENAMHVSRIPNFIDINILKLPEEKPVDWILDPYIEIFVKKND